MTKQELILTMRAKAQTAKTPKMIKFWLGNIKSVKRNYPPTWK
jgi:hypothetical protein